MRTIAYKGGEGGRGGLILAIFVGTYYVDESQGCNIPQGSLTLKIAWHLDKIIP